MSNELDDLLETNSKSEKPKTSIVEPISAPRQTLPPQLPKTSLGDIEITYSPSRVSNYATLKTIAKILKGFAWITGIGGVISIISSLGYADGRYGPDSEFYIFLALGLTAFFVAIQSSLFSESINVLLDIEANSRQAAKTLERILKSQ